MKLKKYSFKKVKSTNDIAIKLVKSGVKRGIIISEQQTKGRGQRGNKWISNRGNLFLTVFFKISKKISIKKITRINIMIIQKIISKLVNINASIKLPNDIIKKIIDLAKVKEKPSPQPPPARVKAKKDYGYSDSFNSFRKYN